MPTVWWQGTRARGLSVQPIAQENCIQYDNTDGQWTQADQAEASGQSCAQEDNGIVNEQAEYQQYNADGGLSGHQPTDAKDADQGE
jgi:hypothetical protein